MACRGISLFGAMAVLLMAGNGALAADAVDRQNSAASSANVNPAIDGTWAQILDHDVPLADRQRLLADMEAKAAQSNDPHVLYMLGSLYHTGQRIPDSPVQQDPKKASLYLGNAAIRGSVLAMAKMAEIKLAAGQYREAMNWAQIYAHYALLSKQDRQQRDAYAAELVQRIMDHIGDSQMAAIMTDVNSFIATYDVDIKAGISGEATLNHLHPTSPRHHFKAPLDERAPDSGIADFIVGFKPDGSVASVQLLDAVPRMEVAAMLREHVATLTVMPAPNGDDHALRYAWVPAMLDDQRYRTTTRH